MCSASMRLQNPACFLEFNDIGQQLGQTLAHAVAVKPNHASPNVRGTEDGRVPLRRALAIELQDQIRLVRCCGFFECADCSIKRGARLIVQAVQGSEFVDHGFIHFCEVGGQNALAYRWSGRQGLKPHVKSAQREQTCAASSLRTLETAGIYTRP